MSTRKADQPHLDLFDLKILAALHRRGRISKSDLANAIGLSPTPLGARIDKLEASGLIRGYHADVDIERLANLALYHVTISIKDYTPQKARLFETEAAKIVNIIECDAVLGTTDYILKVYVSSISHYLAVMAPLTDMEIDYTTYPISRILRRCTDLSLLDLIGMQQPSTKPKK